MQALQGSHPHHEGIVQEVLASPALANRPEIEAALWLYVDDLSRSHTVSQGIDTPTGSYWHAIMHRREGDFDNSRYWLRRAAGHPLLAQSQTSQELIRLVELAGGDRSELVKMQQEEWQALFQWCVQNCR